MANISLTKAQLEAGYEHFFSWFPDEKAKADQHKNEIINSIYDGTPPPQAVLNMEFSPSMQHFPEVNLSTSSCVGGILTVLVDVGVLVLDVFSIRTLNKDAISRALLSEMGQETINGLKADIRQLSTAVGKMKKARAIFTLFGGIWRAGGFKGIFHALYEKMSWWDWAKTAIEAIAQIIVWVASDGVAMIAKITELLVDIESTVEDAIAAVQACD